MAYAMTKRGSQDNCITYEFVCDTLTDMNAIENKYRTIGSIAIVLEGDSGGLEVYITGSNKQWNALNGGATTNTPGGLEIYICTSEEIDQLTGLPDIDEPDESTLYLVPAGNTTGNLYEEYVYVNDAWEKFGTANIDLSNVVTDVQVNGSSILSNGVANFTKATSSNLGLVKINGYGLNIDGAGTVVVDYAGQSFIKAGYDSFKPVTPSFQHQAVFYGLAKAAGQDMKESNNAVGTYTTEAASAIRTMIGAGTYSKPVGGIPAADLASGVIPSLSGYATESFVTTRIPTPPQVDGDYVLKLNVTSGVATYSWLPIIPGNAAAMDDGTILTNENGEIIGLNEPAI